GLTRRTYRPQTIRHTTCIDYRKTQRCRYNDHKRLAIQRHRATDDRWITCELSPKIVVQDRHRVAVRRSILFRKKTTTDDRMDFQKIEVITTNEKSQDVERLLAPGHAHRRKGVSGHRAQDAVFPGVVHEVQIRGLHPSLDM